MITQSPGVRRGAQSSARTVLGYRIESGGRPAGVHSSPAGEALQGDGICLIFSARRELRRNVWKNPDRTGCDDKSLEDTRKNVR